MLRGDVWRVEFDPAVGSEIRKTRPGDYRQQQFCQSQLEPGYCGAAYQQQRTPLPRRSTRISRWQRQQSHGRPSHDRRQNSLTSKIDALSKADLQAVELALRVQLALPIYGCDAIKYGEFS
jgi:mRNA interferase MazF